MASVRAFVPDPTPAAPAASHPPSARTPLFPAGLVVDVRTTSHEGLPAAAIGWCVQYAQLGTGRFRGSWVGVHTASVQVGIEGWSLGMLKRGQAPRGSLTFLVPVGPAASVRLQGRPAEPGGVVVLFDGDELDHRSSGPARLVSISVERAALDGHVRGLLGRQLGELRLEGRLSGLRADGALLVRLVRDLAARAAANPRLLRDSDVAARLERKVIETLFARFETAGAPETPCRGRAVARKAEAWLRENLAEPPTIAALCQVVNVSERTLHAAFRENLGTTPKAYLKMLRLNSAHHDLLRAGARTRVTDVALDWGFVHFGWFSQDYRRLFGETPSQTLHRARAEAARRGTCGHHRVSGCECEPGPGSRTAVSTTSVADAYAI